MPVDYRKLLEGPEPSFEVPGLGPPPNVGYGPQVPLPTAQPEFHHQSQDDFDFPEMTYPAQQAFGNYIQDQPMRQDYAPGRLRQILGAAGGFSAGWQQGPQAGINVATGIVETPYRQALEQWKIGLAPRQSAAQIEATTAGQLSNNAYRRARLRLTKDKQDSIAYTGQWKPKSFYNLKTKTLRNVENNEKLGQWRDPVTKEPVPGQGPDEEARIQQFENFKQVTLNPAGIPEVTMSQADKQKLQAKDPAAFVKSNEQVAVPQEVGVDKLGEQAGLTNTYTGTKQGLISVESPNRPAPPSLRKAPMSSGELNQRAGINIMRNDFNTLKANLPEILKQMVGPRKSMIAKAKASNYNFLAEFWDKAKPTPLQAAALTAETSLQNAIIRREEGANIPQWIWNALEKTLPLSKQPPEVYTQNYERFEKVLKMLEDERNLVDEGRFNLQFSKVMEPPATPQTKLKWKKQKATGKIFVQDPGGKARPAKDGDVLDPAMEIK